MRALCSFNLGRSKYYFLPSVALRAGLIALAIVIAVVLLLDHVVLARLEHQGLLGGSFWQEQNRLVVAEHQQNDRTEPYHVSISRPEAQGREFIETTGVRAWTGHGVTQEKTSAKRILVLGDSFVWGSPYLSLNHAWWRQLAQELQRRGYRDVEVIAAGSAGLSTAEELQLARQVAPDFRPDLIIWGYVTNDPDERVILQLGVELVKPHPFPGRGWLLYGLPRLMPLLEHRREDKLARRIAANHSATNDWYDEWELELLGGENFGRYQETVQAVGAFQREVGIPALLVTLPNSPSRAHFEPRYAPVLPLWKNAGIPTYDLLPAFLEKYGDVPRSGPEALAWGINPADGHPGPRACHFFAVQTADILARDFPQSLGPQDSAPPAAAVKINDWLPASLSVTASKAAPGAYSLTYPANNTRLVSTTLDVPTALVALALPTRLSEIALAGENLSAAQAWVSTLDPAEGYDDGHWIDLGSQSGKNVRWLLPQTAAGRATSVIRFTAEFNGASRELQLQLIPAATAEVAP